MEKSTISSNGNGVNGTSKCPFSGGALHKSAGGGTRNRDWWPRWRPIFPPLR